MRGGGVEAKRGKVGLVEQTTFDHDANAAIDRFEGDQVVVVCVS